MKLRALLKLLRLPFATKLLSGNKVSMHIWIRYFGDEFIVLFEEVLDLMIDMGKIVEFEPFLLEFFSGGLTVFVVGVVFF
jgi:hypothetical protein